MAKFQINKRNPKGFRMTFYNGITVSVQWGESNNASLFDNKEQRDKAEWAEAKSAEIAIGIKGDIGNLTKLAAKELRYEQPNGGTIGWCSAEVVAGYLHWAATKVLDKDTIPN